jgi:PRC-barrel domain
VAGLEAPRRVGGGGHGQKVGTVEDFYVHPVERKVRFLDIGIGGFLGIGQKHFLIPVEAVRDANEDRVSIDQSRERVLGAPDFRVDTAPTAAYLRGIYGHYGYPPPLGPPFAMPVHPGTTSTESSRQAPNRRRAR